MLAWPAPGVCSFLEFVFRFSRFRLTSLKSNASGAEDYSKSDIGFYALSIQTEPALEKCSISFRCIRAVKRLRSGMDIAGEYVAAGASATDDKRPAFQRMIDRACDGDNSLDAIVVHSFSRGRSIAITPARPARVTARVSARAVRSRWRNLISWSPTS